MRIMTVEAVIQKAVSGNDVVARIGGSHHAVLAFGNDVPLEDVERRVEQVNGRVRQTDLRVFHAAVLNGVEVDAGHPGPFDHAIANNEMCRRVIDVEAVVRLRLVDSPAFNDIRIRGRTASGEDPILNGKIVVPIDVNRSTVPPPKEPSTSDLPPHQDDRQHDGKRRHRSTCDLPAHHRLLKKTPFLCVIRIP